MEGELLIKWNRNGEVNTMLRADVRLVDGKEREIKVGSKVKIIWKRERWDGEVLELLDMPPTKRHKGKRLHYIHYIGLLLVIN